MTALQGILAVLHEAHGTAFIEAMRTYLRRYDHDKAKGAKH